MQWAGLKQFVDVSFGFANRELSTLDFFKYAHLVLFTCLLV